MGIPEEKLQAAENPTVVQTASEARSTDAWFQTRRIVSLGMVFMECLSQSLPSSFSLEEPRCGEHGALCHGVTFAFLQRPN